MIRSEFLELSASSSKSQVERTTALSSSVIYIYHTQWEEPRVLRQDFEKAAIFNDTKCTTTHTAAEGSKRGTWCFFASAQQKATNIFFSSYELTKTGRVWLAGIFGMLRSRVLFLVCSFFGVDLCVLHRLVRQFDGRAAGVCYSCGKMRDGRAEGGRGPCRTSVIALPIISEGKRKGSAGELGSVHLPGCCRFLFVRFSSLFLSWRVGRPLSVAFVCI